ncbi:SSI family serine proteinase inhibitor [Actinoplanes sp. NPDC049118]|uniref:SSI family serine proteinase inhibitor n=1 Tax=Actinoplanes sp. NPDC049118 TaxID=3155769 RepID=UPI0033EE7AAE
MSRAFHKEEFVVPIHHIGVLATSLSTTAALLATGAPAAAAPAAVPPPGSNLVLAVFPAGQSTGPLRLATLECDPDGGSHAAAGSACDDLHAVDGDLTALADDGGICTREYRPVTAIAAGTWQGDPVAYRQTFPNHCVLINATGKVFDF